MTHTPLIRCAGCGTVTTMAAFGSAIGAQCAQCATHAQCHDCDSLLPRDLLSDLGDGYLTCVDCQNEVVARAQMAAQPHR